MNTPERISAGIGHNDTYRKCPVNCYHIGRYYNFNELKFVLHKYCMCNWRRCM